MTHTKTRKYFPGLLNFATLFFVWILLTNSFTVGNLLLAFILAWFIPFLVGGLRETTASVKKPLKAVQYLFLLLGDIVMSNVIVARQVLGPMQNLQPGFISIPLDMREDLPITLLASSISLTPGTVSTELSKDKQTLYVHALNVTDEQELIAAIKKRYEAPLKEIFGC